MSETADCVEGKLLDIESEIENVCRLVCPIRGGSETYDELKESLKHLREAMRQVWKFRE